MEGSWRANYIKWGLPGPGHGTCNRAVTLPLSLGPDLLCWQSQYKRKAGKGNKEWNNHPTYALVQTLKSHNRLVKLNGDLSADPADGATTPPIYWDPEVMKPMRTAFVPDPDPKRTRREERSKTTSKSDPVLHISTSKPILFRPYIAVARIARPGQCRNWSWW